MKHTVAEQLTLFVRSLLLGGTLALVYDLVRCMHRLGGKLWREVLDTLVVLSAAVTFFLFVMAGGGELRIFILLGMLIGGTVYFGILSRPLRPLWLFWQEVLLLPVRLLTMIGKKFWLQGGKLFSFCKRRCKIKPLWMQRGEIRLWRNGKNGSPSDE